MKNALFIFSTISSIFIIMILFRVIPDQLLIVPIVSSSIYIIMVGKGENIGDSEKFLYNLRLNLNKNLPKLRLLKASNNKNLKFSYNLDNSIKAYELSGSTYQFRDTAKNNSTLFNDIINVFTISLNDSTSVKPFIKMIYKKFRLNQTYKIKISNQIKSSNVMHYIGGSLFLPIFAGISYQILNLTNPNSSIYFVPVIITYIILSNLIDLFFSSITLENMGKSINLTFISIGVLLFTSIIAKNILR